MNGAVLELVDFGSKFLILIRTIQSRVVKIHVYVVLPI